MLTKLVAVVVAYCPFVRLRSVTGMKLAKAKHNARPSPDEALSELCMRALVR